MRTIHIPDSFGEANVTVPLEDLLSLTHSIYEQHDKIKKERQRSKEGLHHLQNFLDHLLVKNRAVVNASIREFNETQNACRIEVDHDSLRITLLQ